jgi:hypothetical protein
MKNLVKRIESLSFLNVMTVDLYILYLKVIKVVFNRVFCNSLKNSKTYLR